MNTKEIWKPVPSLPGVVASSEGRLMVEPYQAPMPNGALRTYGGYPTSGQKTEEGRMVYVLRKKTHKVHQLVCEAFHGPKPFPKAVCMHADSNNSNNRPENLSWGTQKENLNHPDFLNWCASRTGDANPHKRITKADCLAVVVEDDGENLSDGGRKVRTFQNR